MGAQAHEQPQPQQVEAGAAARVDVAKPGRSEECASAGDQASHRAQAEAYFAEHAPKHGAPKPSRSEASDSDDSMQQAGAAAEDLNRGERALLAALNQDSTPVVPRTATEPEDPEAHHATAYYTCLCVGAQHCPPGEAFIRLDVDVDRQRVPGVPSQPGRQCSACGQHGLQGGEHTNPARDDWTA